MERLYMEKAGSLVTFLVAEMKGGSLLRISSSSMVVKVCRRIRPRHLG